MRFKSTFRTLERGLLVSCQAPEGDPFHDPESVARFAQAAERGGAAGLRVNGPMDIAATRRVTGLPIVGIQKREIPFQKIRTFIMSIQKSNQRNLVFPIRL